MKKYIILTAFNVYFYCYTHDLLASELQLITIGDCNEFEIGPFSRKSLTDREIMKIYELALNEVESFLGLNVDLNKIPQLTINRLKKNLTDHLNYQKN